MDQLYPGDMVGLMLMLAAVSAQGADWPRFRGPNGSGVSDARNLPAEFGKTKNLVWTAEVPGGTSSPIVAGDRIYLTAFEKDERLLLALDARTGKLAWRQGIAKDRAEAAHPLNGPATPTPVSDGRNVFVFFPEIGLLSYDRDGKMRWKAPLGPFHSVQGLAGSPVLVDGLVVLLVDQTKDSFIAAFDAKTGEQRWKAERPNSILGGYATPIVYRPRGGPAQIIAGASGEITGYQLGTGERLWWAKGLLSGPAASPVLDGDTIYFNEPSASEDSTPFSVFLPMDKNKDGKITRDEVKDPGMQRLVFGTDATWGNNDGALEESEWKAFDDSMKRTGGLMALKLGGAGDLAQSAVRWRLMKGIPYLTSAVVYQGVVYSIRDGGILTSVDPETGQVLKQGRVEGALDKYYASPVAADGKIFLTSENGKIAVVKAGREWERLAVNDLDEMTYAGPAVVDGRVYVRTRKALYCFGR